MQPPLQSRAFEEPAAATDAQLVAEVLAKDRKATADFVARCADYVYPFVRRRLMPRTASVDDVMQEVLLAAWQSLPNFRGDFHLRAWVLGIARHKVEDHYRKVIREVVLEDDDDFAHDAPAQPGFDEELGKAEQQERVQRTLLMLPEAYCAALLWRYRDNRSTRDMAQATGKTEKAIERLLARARENFRRRWTDAQS